MPLILRQYHNLRSIPSQVTTLFLLLLLHLSITRDLKPANLMLGGSYLETDMQRKIVIHELGVVKLADFGELTWVQV
jgi:serine/threonine protein kinase